MKKKLYLSIIFLCIAFLSYSQISLNTITETSVQDSKNAAISLYHTNGTIYHFQSSWENIYVKKVSAYDFSPIGNGYRLNTYHTSVVHGGFIDPSGYIVIYGKVYLGGTPPNFIFKIDPNTLQIVNSKYSWLYVIDACWGEVNSNLTNQSNIYAFLGGSGRIFTTDLSLNSDFYDL